MERTAIRGLILTPDHEVLLIRIRPPDGSEHFWIVPGGGLEQGETGEEALRRELREELGLTNFVAGPVVWRRHHIFTWRAGRISQREEYRVIHLDRFEPSMADVEEAKVMDCFRWWRIDDLEKAEERLTPLSLAKILQRYIVDGAPMELPDEEILVD